jgi:hypothetical protein
VVGWKLPATINSGDKKEVKAPTESQLAAAERLSKGLSVAEQQHKYLKNRSKAVTPRVIHPSIVMDHRNYIPTINITNVAFNANIISPSNVAGNAQNDRMNEGGYSASVLRQQQFRFDSKRDLNAPMPQSTTAVTSEKRALAPGSTSSPKQGVVNTNTIEKEAVLRQLFPNWF